MGNIENDFYDTLEEMLAIIEDMMDNRNLVSVFKSDLKALIEVKDKLNNIQNTLF